MFVYASMQIVVLPHVLSDHQKETYCTNSAISCFPGGKLLTPEINSDIKEVISSSLTFFHSVFSKSSWYVLGTATADKIAEYVEYLQIFIYWHIGKKNY